MKGLSRIVLVVVVVAGFSACKKGQAAIDAKASTDSEAASAVAAVVGAKDSVSTAGLVWLKSAPAKIELTKSEVTVAQYAACVKAGKCETPHFDDGTCWVNDGQKWYQGKLPASFRGNDQPVVCVDWNQATAFCGWAGGRLPTEQEWYAEASNGGSRKYPWGDAEVTCEYAIWDDDSKTDGCGRDSTWPVCSKERGNSISGLCDMSGNVWEWASTSEGSVRMVRGRSLDDGSSFHRRASARNTNAPPFGNSRYGFRCARSLGWTP